MKIKDIKTEIEVVSIQKTENEKGEETKVVLEGDWTDCPYPGQPEGEKIKVKVVLSGNDIDIERAFCMKPPSIGDEVRIAFSKGAQTDLETFGSQIPPGEVESDKDALKRIGEEPVKKKRGRPKKTPSIFDEPLLNEDLEEGKNDE